MLRQEARRRARFITPPVLAAHMIEYMQVSMAAHAQPARSDTALGQQISSGKAMDPFPHEDS